MIKNKSISHFIFAIFNHLFLLFLGLICLFPMVHIFSVSVSEPSAVVAGRVVLIPIGFVTDAYKVLSGNTSFIRAFFISVGRVIIGSSINMLLIVLTAYPLSRESNELKGRNTFMWFLVFPMLFSGGLIPSFILVRNLGLINSFWVLVLPGAIPIFSVIMMMNFFRNLPRSIYDAAVVDGASHWIILLRIFIPLSMASFATLLLFSMVAHWNAWFDALIYLQDANKWPLQTYLQIIIKQTQDLVSIAQQGDYDRVRRLSNRAIISSQIILTTLPILLVYPFIQKHFVKGVIIGSVKE